jgi:hypothetical protein
MIGMFVCQQNTTDRLRIELHFFQPPQQLFPGKSRVDQQRLSAVRNDKGVAFAPAAQYTYFQHISETSFKNGKKTKKILFFTGKITFINVNSIYVKFK